MDAMAIHHAFGIGSRFSSMRPEILPELTTATVIGISVAIAGNILISLSLNIQKLAHKRLDAQKSPTDTSNGPYSNSNHRRVDTMLEEDEDEHEDSDDSATATPRPSTSHPESESQPLVPFPRAQVEYGSTDHHQRDKRPGSSIISRLLTRKKAVESRDTLPVSVMPVEVLTEQEAVQHATSNGNGQKKDDKNARENSTTDPSNGNESEYLKSKLWWTGFLLMNVGEMGNFISYAWAPASVVAPLGTFALIANCLFAPLILGERFRKRDLLGIMIAIIGAVTVVLASNASSDRLNPDELVKAISQIPFIVYSCMYLVGIAVLATLSQGPMGQEYVLVDVGLCALFGGFTVLSTKAVSTLLTMQWSQVFTKFITYPVMLVLVVTGVGQIRYLNRALMRFDSKVLSLDALFPRFATIVGSAILYGDFRRATFHQVVTFLYGCGATFLGVFIISWTPEPKGEEEDDGTNEHEGEEATPHEAHPDPPIGIGTGSLGRRRLATLVLPSGINQHSLRHKRSSPSVMGLSPAQPLLLVHTPPRELLLRDVERGIGIDRTVSTPDSVSRRRALSWFGEQPSQRAIINREHSGRTSRDSSVMGRTHAGEVGRNVG
ncbi:hypothetical protein V5O48_000050 [Marasmius crinis-equi]|uniref:DUF803-domain-containing protein n=1 Tax=Marasmius crinis-equi TaxID=585013 RepID=A0ABR3G2B8_9AGAR